MLRSGKPSRPRSHDAKGSTAAHTTEAVSKVSIIGRLIFIGYKMIYIENMQLTGTSDETCGIDSRPFRCGKETTDKVGLTLLEALGAERHLA